MAVDMPEIPENLELYRIDERRKENMRKKQFEKITASLSDVTAALNRLASAIQVVQNQLNEISHAGQKLVNQQAETNGILNQISNGIDSLNDYALDDSFKRKD